MLGDDDSEDDGEESDCSVTNQDNMETASFLQEENGNDASNFDDLTSEEQINPADNNVNVNGKVSLALLIGKRKRNIGKECPHCKKIFSCTSSLNWHLRIHTGEKPFVCSLCKTKFEQKTNLNRHIRTHTGEKPFEYPICEKKFVQKTNLNSHMKTHTGEKPFECSFCEKKFV